MVLLKLNMARTTDKSIGSTHVIELYGFFFAEDNQKEFYLSLELCNVCAIVYIFKLDHFIFLFSISKGTRFG